MALPPRLRTISLVLANLLLPVAVLIFASGFFPYKPVLPGLATFSDEELARQPRPIFDRVIFMVVDALRSDFVFGHGSGFDFTQSLIRSGAAIPFTAHATPPTVTMPRVKALTTGSVPSFLDLILNFAESDTSSSLAAQDTWLAQLRARGGKLVFYGDDTWLKLFPSAVDRNNDEDDKGSSSSSSSGGDFFARSDGTSSFFVSDFTQVDNNVTRHVPGELAREDWDAMIMHYLGLDHIGHKTGPQGPNMLPKQREMDGIVRNIYETMQKRSGVHERTLLVLAGDHGMNAGGNHGGSGPGETEPALVFVNPRFAGMNKMREYECPTLPKEGTEFHFYTKVQQSDLIPTLAGLMGLPVSRNSLGISIEELSGLWTEQEKLRLMEQNAKQMLGIVEATHGHDSFRKKVEQFRTRRRSNGASCKDTNEGEEQLACFWADAEVQLEQRHIAHDKAQAALKEFLHTAQETLSGTASSYNIPNMIIGMALTAVILVLTILSFPSHWPPSSGSSFLSLIALLYGIMMFASSYVEEEQHLWYWLTPAWITVLAVLQSRNQPRSIPGLTIASSALLAIHRISIRWNQTGQKHAGAPDIVHTFFPNAHVLMWLLILATYAHTGVALVRRSFAGLVATEYGILASVVLILPAIVFKLNFTQADAPELVRGLALQIREWSEQFDLVLQARVAFAFQVVATVAVSVLAIASYRVSRKTDSLAGALPTLAERLHVLLTLFLMTQTRAPNVPLFLGMEVQRMAVMYLLYSSQQQEPRTGQHVVTVAVTTLLFSHVYFFCMGGSNSISSIDLSNAYNGVADYDIVAVGVLLFASNWTGPIWWCSAAVQLLTSSPGQRSRDSESISQKSRSWVDDERSKLHAESLKAVMGPEKSVAGSSTPSHGYVWQAYVCCITLFIAAGLLAVMAACTALRTHLFIWTVFSPKYLYAMAWSIGWHLIVNIGLGSLMTQLASIA